MAVAAELGRQLAAAGIEVVFGGSATGCMGALADGALNEALEAITLKRLAVIAHPIVLINTDGYFDTLLQMLQRMVAQGFADPAQFALLQVVENPGAALSALRRH